MPTKKSAKKSSTAKKSVKKAARKAASKAAKKTASKAAKKAVQKKVASTEKSSSGKKASRKARASDIIRQQAHTPAIFKTSAKRPTHVHFTIEDVREVLKKRAEEEKQEALEAKAKQNNKVAKNEGKIIDQDDPPRQSKHHAASLDDILGLSGGPGSFGNRAGQGKVPRKFQKYHKLLIELRDEVRKELNLHSNDTLKRSQKEDAGDIAISVDAGTDNFDRDFALSLLSSEQEALNEIEAAIQRIYNGTYGNCEVTGEPIKAERLEAVPFTRFSVEGQKEYEMNTRKRVSRAGAFINEASGEKITFGDDDAES